MGVRGENVFEKLFHCYGERRLLGGKKDLKVYITVFNREPATLLHFASLLWLD